MSKAHGGIEHEGCHYSTADNSAWHTFVCGFCGTDTSGAVIAFTSNVETQATYVEMPHSKWIRCTSCGRGSVLNREHGTERIDPPRAAVESVEYLPDDLNQAYGEACACFSTRAYTACTLMCRKILMHVAVDKGDAEGKNFKEYLDYLENQGYVTPPLRDWVDQIRQNGNLATHELPPANSGVAENSLVFTAQILRIIYEMPGKADQFSQGKAAPAP